MSVEEIKSSHQNLENSNLNPEIEKEIDEVLSIVEKILDFWWIDMIKKYFNLNWLNDFFDFYQISLSDFKNVIWKSKKLLNFYKEQTGESFSKISRKWILKFSRKIWIERPSYEEILSSIKQKLSTIWINTLNELSVISINEFKKIFWDDNEFKYFFLKVFKISLVNIDTQIYREFFEKIKLELLDETKLFTKLRFILSNNKIENLDDLEKIWVREFDELVSNNLLLESYFVNKWLLKSFIKKEDIFDFWVNIWLKNREVDKNKYLKTFLNNNRIFNYSDLEEYDKLEIRALLWNDPICRQILEWFWLTYLQDYRIEHLKKFSRFVWLDWIPKDFEYDENKSKKLILNILNANNINCIFSLKLNWLKWFRRIFKQQDIWNIYNDINTFIKNNTWKTIPNLRFEDLENIWLLLGLQIIWDKEHKTNLLEFLSKSWISLDELNKSKVKSDSKFWNNPALRYFLEKVWWPTDIKLLRTNHIDDMKNYINNI